MHVRKPLLAFAASAALLCTTGGVSASPDPRGVWVDHTGRGAVEITDCGGALCGRVVWLKDENNAEACGIQILGDVKPAGAGVWDKGWIYDPEEDAKFSVELKPMGPDKLRVLGYLGTKLFSETLIWQRAPDNLQRCGNKETTAALDPKVEKENVQAPPASTSEAPKLPADDAPLADQQTAAKSEATAEAAARSSEPNREHQRRSGKLKECKIQTPWVSLSFPCPE